MNQTIREIYEEYRDEMMRTLGEEELSPDKFLDPEFVERFESEVSKLDTLIWLYADLLATNRN